MPYHREGDLARERRAQAVSNRLYLIEAYRVTVLKAAVHGSRSLRLDPNYAHLRVLALDSQGDPRNQAASADRHDDRAHLLLERPPDALRAGVETAVRRCPRQAIALRDG